MTFSSLTVTAFVQVHGPLFDGQAEEALDRFTLAAREAIADEGADMLRAFPMDKTGRASGGFQANVHAEPYGDTFRIRGPMIAGVTWAPWLEGSSKRNSSTRFRGYHLFRAVAAELDAKATEIAGRKLQEYLPQMGGA